MKEEIMNASDKPLIIFKTEEDRVKDDITLMSNFFDGYIIQMCKNENNKLEVINDITQSNFELIKEAIERMEVVSNDHFILVPDLESLPSDVKEKLKLGIYKIAKSKQVNENLRPVIVDNKNIRVKDITLKKEKNIPEDVSNKVDIQMQMKEIFNKLIEIQDIQEYQLELDRNRDIIVPFLNARDKIIDAEEELHTERKINILLKANEDISCALNSLYTNLLTTYKSFVNCINNPLKKYLSLKNKYMEYIVSDLQIITKYVGVQLQLLEYLGENKKAQQALNKYNSTLNDFFTTPRTKNQMTISDLLQDYYPYNHKEKNMWYNLKQDYVKGNKYLFNKTITNKEIYLLSFCDEGEGKNEE